MHTRKNLAIAAAMVGLVASAQAEYYPGSADFEGGTALLHDDRHVNYKLSQTIA